MSEIRHRLSPLRSRPLPIAFGVFSLAAAAAAHSPHASAGEIVPPPTILWVGGGGGACDFASPQAAIDAAASSGNTVIRIANNIAYDDQHLTIADKNVELQGGFPGCELASPDPDSRTTLAGNGGDSVIDANAASARNVVLRNMVLRGGGSSDPLTEAGGGLRVRGGVTARVFNSRIGDNESSFGGGVAVSGEEAALELDEGTIVGAGDGLAGNRAVAAGAVPGQGGGMACSNASLRIVDARIRGNSADSGGGLYANHCEVIIEPRPGFVQGDFYGPIDGFATFFDNLAGIDGGAIYARGGSQIDWRSLTPGRPAGRAVGNRAGNAGGAFHLSGNPTRFRGVWLRLEQNHAPNTGAAVHVEDEALFSFFGAAGMNCRYATCPAIVDSNFDEPANNDATGGAVYAASGADVGISQTVLAGNTAFAGAAIAAGGEGTRVSLSQVLIHRNFLTLPNNGNAPVFAFAGADLQWVHVTTAGNLRPGGILVTTPLSSVLLDGTATSLDLRNSILSNDADVAIRVSNGATISNASCNLNHEQASLVQAILGDPHYVSPTGDSPDFTPDFDSPALDLCAIAQLSTVGDLYGHQRPVDLLNVTDASGPYDAGAIERGPPSDVIFRNGFEIPITL